MLSLGLSLTSASVLRRGGIAPGLAALFSLGESGVWYDPSDLSSMFQDSAGTTAAVIDSPVGRINDKSGRGNHATQAVAASRPILRVDGGGRPCLEFDGVDDFLRAAFVISQPWERVSAIQQITWTSADRLFSGAAAIAGSLLQLGSTPQLHMSGGGSTLSNGALAVGVNGVVTERHSGATSRIAVNNGTYGTGDIGTTATDGLTVGDIGSSVGLVRAGNMRFYGVVMRAGNMTDAQMSEARSYLAGKAGVTL